MEDVRPAAEPDKQPVQPPPMPHVERSGSLAVGQSTEIVPERAAGEGSVGGQQEKWIPPSKAFEGTLRPQFEMGLAKREAEVIALKAMGYTTKEAADILGVSENTVKTHQTRAGNRLRIYPQTRLVCTIYEISGPLSRVRIDEAGLTDREAQIVPLIVKGLTDEQIGEKLYLATDTIRSHIAIIIGKVRARNRLHAVTILYGAAMPLSKEEWEPSVRSGIIKQE